MFKSATRLAETDPDLYNLLSLFIAHSHISGGPFTPLSFNDLKDIPLGLTSTLNGEDGWVANDRPLRVDTILGQQVITSSIEPDGISSVFRLNWLPITGSETIYKHGKRLLRDTDYTIDGEYVTFTQPPEIGTLLVADLFPVSPLPLPNSSQFITNETPLLQANSLVTKYPAEFGGIHLYKQGVRQYLGIDYTQSSRRRMSPTTPDASAIVIVDYLTASGTQPLHLVANESFTNYFVLNPSATTFTLAQAPLANTVQIYIEGTRRQLGVDYTVSGTIVTILDTDSLQNGPNVIVDYSTSSPQVLTGYRTHQTVQLTGSNTLILEATTTDTILANSHQVYMQGLRREQGVDYTISGARNNELNWNSSLQEDTNIIVDYQV